MIQIRDGLKANIAKNPGFTPTEVDELVPINRRNDRPMSERPDRPALERSYSTPLTKSNTHDSNSSNSPSSPRTEPLTDRPGYNYMTERPPPRPSINVNNLMGNNNQPSTRTMGPNTPNPLAGSFGMGMPLILPPRLTTPPILKPTQRPPSENGNGDVALPPPTFPRRDDSNGDTPPPTFPRRDPPPVMPRGDPPPVMPRRDPPPVMPRGDPPPVMPRGDPPPIPRDPPPLIPRGEPPPVPIKAPPLPKRRQQILGDEEEEEEQFFEDDD